MFRGASSTDNVSLYAAFVEPMFFFFFLIRRKEMCACACVLWARMETHNEPPLLRLRMPLQSFAWVDARNRRAASVGHWATHRRPRFSGCASADRQLPYNHTVHRKLTGNWLKYTERLPMTTIVPSRRERM